MKLVFDGKNFPQFRWHQSITRPYDDKASGLWFALAAGFWNDNRIQIIGDHISDDLVMRPGG